MKEEPISWHSHGDTRAKPLQSAAESLWLLVRIELNESRGIHEVGLEIETIGLPENGAMVLLSVMFILLVLPNLETYPPTWFDEGVFLQVPKNLILYGKYAVRSSEGFRMLDSILGTGRTVLVPIALVFKFFGIGLVKARLVLVVFLALLVYAFYAVTRRIYGREVALVASLLFIATPHYWVNPTVPGRQVLGEVPALLLFLTARRC